MNKKTFGAIVLAAILIANVGGITTTQAMMMQAKASITMAGGAKMYSTKDIVSNVVNAPNLTTLVAAVKAAGLVATLQSNGPFTVFGPDNNAFAKIDSATIASLLKPENKDSLVNILTYHVVSGTYTIKSLKDKQVLTTVQGGTLTVAKKSKKIKGKWYTTVKLTDDNESVATIITKNVMQKNGIAHVIDTVLMPKAKVMQEETMKETITMVGGEKMYSTKDIVSNVVNAPNLTTLVAAVKAAGLVATLQSDGPFTVFGPDNNAFAKIDSKTLEYVLKPENKDMLVKILTYHVISGTIKASDLTDGQVLTTVQGGKLTVTKKDGKIMITDSQGGTATIITADVMQKNGIAHVIDTVLMPKF